MTTTAQELRDVDVTCPWKQPYRELRLRAANELEALQKKVDKLNAELTAERILVKSLREQATTVQNEALRES